ncbi:glycosyltransferase family 2 protein [Gemmatimonas sp.]
MLYLAIPAHNEVATIGVLLWRLRTVLAEFPREYEVVVYDDASTDETAAVAEQYERAMPVSVIRGSSRLGYAGAVDAVLRHLAARTRYPRRDAVLLLQGDFTDPPVVVPEFARRFEGGADLVVGERRTVADAPSAVKRLFKYGHWAMRPFVKVEGVADLTASMRLVRISALREAIRLAGNAPLVSGDSWTANADLLLRLAPHARRVESVPMEPTYGVRMRDTRRVAMADTMSVLKWAWSARGRRAVVGSSPAESGPDDRRGSRQHSRRRDEPELSVERIREKVRERDGSSGIDGDAQETRRGRRDRHRDGARSASGERSERTERGERSTRSDRPERAPRGERTEREKSSTEETTSGRSSPSREPREPREPRDKRRAEREPRAPESRSGESARPPRRRDEGRSPFEDPTIELDDPFAAPTSRRDAPKVDESLNSAAAADAAVADAAAASAASIGAVADFGAAHTAEALEPESAGVEADADADESESESEGAEGAEADGTKRKRRRNRRSRRGRRRKSADGTEGEAEVADGGDGGDVDAADRGNADRGNADRGNADRGNADRGNAEAAVRFTPGDHIDGEPVSPRRNDEGDEDSDDDSDDDEVAGVESMSEGAPRPRRRGRRGRRGGARRSRGKKGAADADAPPSPEGE